MKFIEKTCYLSGNQAIQLTFSSKYTKTDQNYGFWSTFYYENKITPYQTNHCGLQVSNN